MNKSTYSDLSNDPFIYFFMVNYPSQENVHMLTTHVLRGITHTGKVRDSFPRKADRQRYYINLDPYSFQRNNLFLLLTRIENRFQSWEKWASLNSFMCYVGSRCNNVGEVELQEKTVLFTVCLKRGAVHRQTWHGRSMTYQACGHMSSLRRHFQEIFMFCNYQNKE